MKITSTNVNKSFPSYLDVHVETSKYLTLAQKLEIERKYNGQWAGYTEVFANGVMIGLNVSLSLNK